MDTLEEEIQAIKQVGENYREIQAGVATLRTGQEDQKTEIDKVSAEQQSDITALKNYSEAVKEVFDEFQEELGKMAVRVDSIERISPIEQQCVELMQKAQSYSNFTVAGTAPEGNPHVDYYNTFGCQQLINGN